MRVRIEIEWERLVQIVGVGRARGIARAGNSRVLSLEDCAACLQSMTDWNARLPWEKKEP